MGYRVGVDIGGTFTDFCALDEATGRIRTLKVLSTPDQPGSEVMTGLAELERRYGIVPADISYFTHGTTVGVNAVIQRRGIRLALFTTEHFGDVLEVARLKMPNPYSLLSQRPEPLVTRDLVFPVRERLRSDGSVDQPVDEASVLSSVDRAVARGAEGIVVALINSYRSAAHEHRVREIIRHLEPELPVFCSADVWAIIREYERTTTAVIHGYVQPRVSHYLGSLQRALAEAGVPAEAMVTKSNGGVMSAELGKDACAQMLLSGTAAGVIGASHVGTLAGFPETMSVDIGGTSADVAFIRDGQPQYGVGELIGEHPIHIPSVAVTSIGAGGGSIAWVDELGVLRVGPDSAGSTPGPACYGRGGDRPTVTDAFATLGYIGQVDLGYSAISIDRELAHAAIETVAGPMGLEVVDAARAIVDIAVSGMYAEVSKLVARQGIEPRDFAIQAFGGAGPMLACFLAEELGITTVVVPETPGVLSALGGLIAEIKNDFIATSFLDLEPGAAPEEAKLVGREIQEGFRELEREALSWLLDQQGHDGGHRFIHSADMRYRGQSFEIECALGADLVFSGAMADGDFGAVAEALHLEHERTYGHADRDAPVQVVNLRLVVVGLGPKPEFPSEEIELRAAEPTRTVPVDLGSGGAVEVPLFERSELTPGHSFVGPCVVAQADCTTCVPPGFEGSVDGHRNLILRWAR